MGTAGPSASVKKRNRSYLLAPFRQHRLTPELLFNKKVRRYVPQDIYNYIYKDDDDGRRSELRLTDNVLVVSSSLDADRGVFAVPHYADNKSVGCG